MKIGYLIKNGTVVDGTGKPPFKADIRVRDGRITALEVGLERQDRERVIDATDCYVTPGFIELHNHYDGPMWWNPTMEPMPGYGVTTSINGNCGFSAAPVSDDPVVRAEMVKIFSFFEDIPEKPFLELLPWDWRKWSEYRASLQRNVRIPVNYAAYVGHIAIRLAVMGLEAWDRAATPQEIERMCELLRDALDAGALGLSSNMLDHDWQDRPVPTWKADDAEWSALFDVVASHQGAVVEIIVDYLMRMNAGETLQRMGRIAKGKKIRIQFTGAVPTFAFAAPMIPGALTAFEELRAQGHDFWTSYHHRAPTSLINFVSAIHFAMTNNLAWAEIINTKDEEAKFALLKSPEWRERGRAGWEQTLAQSSSKYPEKILLMESETGAGPVGVTLRDYMDESGVEHPSDALADWVLENGVRSILRLADVPNEEKTLDRMFREPWALGNVSDSGAHGQMFCGVGDNLMLITKYVRDEKRLKIEEAVRIITGQVAEHFGLDDRGILAVGKAADIAVFNLEEIQIRPDRKRWDVPDGEGGRTFRLIRSAAPMRLTMVNGIPTFDNNDFTGKFPGRYIGPAGVETGEPAQVSELV